MALVPAAPIKGGRTTGTEVASSPSEARMNVDPRGWSSVRLRTFGGDGTTTPRARSEVRPGRRSDAPPSATTDVFQPSAPVVPVIPEWRGKRSAPSDPVGHDGRVISAAPVPRDPTVTSAPVPRDPVATAGPLPRDPVVAGAPVSRHSAPPAAPVPRDSALIASPVPRDGTPTVWAVCQDYVVPVSAEAESRSTSALVLPVPDRLSPGLAVSYLPSARP